MQALTFSCNETATRWGVGDKIASPKAQASSRDDCRYIKRRNSSKTVAREEEMYFKFERERLKELGPKRIEKYVIDGPAPEVKLGDPRVLGIEKYNKAERKNELDRIQRHLYRLKLICVYIVLWNLIELIFSIVYPFAVLTDKQTDITETTIPPLLNAVGSSWMIYVSVKGGNLIRSSSNKYRDLCITRFLWICVISLAFFAVQITAMPFVMSLSVYFRYARRLFESDPAQLCVGLLGLGYVVIWLSAIINAACCIIYIATMLLLRRLLSEKDLHELERKALPLGYQIYAKLSPKIII